MNEEKTLTVCSFCDRTQDECPMIVKHKERPVAICYFCIASTLNEVAGYMSTLDDNGQPCRSEP